MIILIISLTITILAFCYGVFFLFKRRKPLYFQLLICAIGCFTLELLFITVAIWCYNYNPIINLGIVGLFGCNFFLFSANYGQLDSIVDDGSNINIKAKKTAITAPAIIAGILIFYLIIVIKNKSLAYIFNVLMMIPACLASYFNIKHLLMPVDSFGFLKATRKCNFIELVFYFLSLIYIFGILAEAVIIQEVTLLLMSILMLLLSLFTVKGAKQWTI